jgi:Immunoglobulin I-set domain
VCFPIEEITFDEAPSPQHPTQFTDALIKCSVSGQPSPSVSWRYRGIRIQTGTEFLIVNEGQQLETTREQRN